MKLKPLSLFLCLAISIPSCSHFSSHSKPQSVYAHQMKQLKKERKRHQKELLQAQRKFFKDLPPTPPISERQVTTTVETASQ